MDLSGYEIIGDRLFYFGEEKRDEMVLNITPDNKIILNAVAESDKFRGVNASSSSRVIPHWSQIFSAVTPI